MVPSLFRLLTAQPQLVVDHVEAYSQLLAEESAVVAQQIKRQLTFQLAGLACVAVSASLLGVALMLWATLPTQGMPAPWLLVATPLAPALAGVWCFLLAGASSQGPAFALLRQQLAADVAMLRASGAP